MALNGKLRTRDRLNAWGVIDYAICDLCSSISVDHIKLRRSYSLSVWSFIAKLYLFSGYPNSWTPLNIWLSRKLEGNFIHCKLGNLDVAGSIYFISTKRNNRISCSGVLDQITSSVRNWESYRFNLDLWRLSCLNFCFFEDGKFYFVLSCFLGRFTDTSAPIP